MLKNELTEVHLLLEKAMKEIPKMMDRGIAQVWREKLLAMQEQLTQQPISSLQ